MRVGFISSFPPSMDGLAVYTYKLCKAMVQMDEDVEILVVANVDESSVDIDRVRVAKALDDSLLYPFRVLRVFAKQKRDVIHCQHEFWLYGKGIYSVETIILFILLNVLRKRIVTTVHGVIPRSSLNPVFFSRHSVGKHFALIKKVYFILLMKTLVALSSLVIVHLKAMKEVLVQEYKCREDKVIVIPHGADYEDGFMVGKLQAREKLGLSKETALLLCFGEIRYGKGLEYAIEAMDKVKDRFPYAKLLIAGRYSPKASLKSRGLLDELRDRIMKLNLWENVLIRAEFIPEYEIPLLFVASDIILLPYTEADVIYASGPLYRAMSYGIPVISSATAPFQDIVKDGRSAMLVRMEDSEDLAQKIILLISNPKLRAKISSELRKMSKMLSWEKIAADTLNVYASRLKNIHTCRLLRRSSLNTRK